MVDLLVLHSLSVVSYIARVKQLNKMTSTVKRSNVLDSEI